MEHIDEGTIHAWLDGALPDDEGRRLESHVAGCAACAAAVAEARGLIAASSRILTALDDVPGGVIPVAIAPKHADASASAPSASAATPAGRGSARRPWYRRPQYVAAAGIAFVAVATTVLLQRGEMRTVADFARESTAVSASAPLEAPTARGALMDSAMTAARFAGERGALPASASDSLPATAAAKRAAPSAGVQAEPSVANMAANVVRAESTTRARLERRREDVRDEAKAPAPPPPPAAAATQAVSAAPAARMAASTSVAGRTDSGAASPAAGSRPLAVSADAISASEKARVAGERDVQLQRAAPGGAADSVSQRRAGAVAGETRKASLEASALAPAPVTPAQVAGCYRFADVDAARAAGLEPQLELEFAAAGVDQSRPAYTVRPLDRRGVTTAFDARTLLRWTLSATGDVALVRGTGGTATRIPLDLGKGEAAAVGAGRAMTSLAVTRIPCPAR